MAGQTRRLAGNALHGTAIAKETVRVVGEEIKTRLVEDGSRVRLSNGETDRVGETLAEGARRHFDALGVMGFRVAGRDAVDLPERLEVVHGDLVAEEMEEGVLQHAPMAVGENKAISIGPIGVLGVEGHELVEENVGGGGQAHRGSGMPGVGLEGRIDLSSTSVYVLTPSPAPTRALRGIRKKLLEIKCVCGAARRGQLTARTRMVLMQSSSSFV